MNIIPIGESAKAHPTTPTIHSEVSYLIETIGGEELLKHLRIGHIHFRETEIYEWLSAASQLQHAMNSFLITKTFINIINIYQNQNNMELVSIIDNKTITTSRAIAWKFGKEHKNIVRSIKNLDCSEEFNALNFEPIYFKDKMNREQVEYQITRDGFVFLVMGFTGKKAAQFKEEYINAFNEMESKLNGSGLSKLDILVESALALREQEQRLTVVEDRINTIEAKTTTRPDYFTIAGYANLKGIKINLKIAAAYGRKAAAICKAQGLQTDTMPDPRFGKVRMYPTSVLEEIFCA